MSTLKPHVKGYSIPLIMLIFVVVSHDRPSIFVFFSVTCNLCTALIFWKFVMDNILFAHFSCVQLQLSRTCLFTSCRFITVQTSTLAFQIMNFPQQKRYIKFCVSGVCLFGLGYTQQQDGLS